MAEVVTPSGNVSAFGLSCTRLADFLATLAVNPLGTLSCNPAQSFSCGRPTLQMEQQGFSQEVEDFVFTDS